MLSLTIFLILIFIHTAILQVSGQCTQNKYGPGCRYDCHCGPGVTCHPQTGCNGNCSVGWDGATCQRQNVALNKPTSQITTLCGRICYNSSYAVDGSIGQTFTETPPCTHTTPFAPAYWTVTLDSVYSIYRFKIYNRNATGCNGPTTQCGARLNKFFLSVGNTSTQNYQVCYEDTTTSAKGPGAIIGRTCSTGGPISGNSVKISLNSGQPLTLCEVLLYVCSSGWYGEFCGQPCGHCWNNNICDKENGVCPVTTGNPTCAAGYKGDTCTTCAVGEYGPDCTYQCGSCADGTTVCDTATGECPVRSGLPTCMAGYTGLKCDQACPGGTFGNLCDESCGQCLDGNLTCDHISGVCPNCAAGWQGDLCKQDCSPGTYGPNCKLTCSVNCLDGPTGCDILSGVCIGGCQGGHTGSYCDQSTTIVIVGSILGVVGLVVLVVAVIILLRSKRKFPTEIQSPTEQPTNILHSNMAIPPDSTSTSDEPNYYNTAQEDNHDYERVFENEYNKVRFSQVEKTSEYSNLS